jgi:hypothetical protein
MALPAVVDDMADRPEEEYPARVVRYTDPIFCECLEYAGKARRQ